MNSARRRKARELLVQALYSTRVGGRPLVDAIIEQVERRRPQGGTMRYVQELQPHLEDGLDALDARIDAVIEGRSAKRVGAVERAILQLGLAELLFRPDVPTAVVIDECNHLVETFATEDSVRFVHGVLDRLAKDVRQGAPKAAPVPDEPDDDGDDMDADDPDDFASDSFGEAT